MISGIGVILVLSAGIGMGIFRARELWARPRQIRALIQALSALETQIVYGEIFLADGFRDCVNGCSEDSITKMFLHLSERLKKDRRCCISEAVVEMRRKMSSDASLGQAEWNMLMFLGEQLGRTGCRETEKQIRLAVEQLKRIEDTAITDAKKKGKLAIYIGACGALMVILVCV